MCMFSMVSECRFKGARSNRLASTEPQWGTDELSELALRVARLISQNCYECPAADSIVQSSLIDS